MHKIVQNTDTNAAKSVVPMMPAQPWRAPRIVLYSHDTLGFGHLRRNMLIARALRESEVEPEILMICGMREAGAFSFPEGVDCVTLPAYAKGVDGTYLPRDLGQTLTPLTALRAKTIKATVLAFDPDIMIVDNVPRGALYELDKTLSALRRRGRTQVVLGLRDVIDSPSIVRQQWLRQRNFETIRNLYDEVWIYGDPNLYDVIEDCGFGDAFRDRARHVGYLDHSVRCATPKARADRDAILAGDASPYVFCAVGGGRDGSVVCQAFARATLPAGHQGILLTGTQMAPSQRVELETIINQRDDIRMVTFISEPIELMKGAAKVVAMGGYNTICEILSLRRPALVVPRVRPRAEQLIRAQRLAERGLIAMQHPDELSPQSLSTWMAAPSQVQHGHTMPDMKAMARVRGLVEELLSAWKETLSTREAS